LDEPIGPSAERRTSSDERLVTGLGAAIRAARQSKRMTVERLGREAGVSTGLISQLERGQGNPSFLTLRRLAEALELPFGHFMQGPQPQGGMVVRADQRKRLVLPQPTEIVHELLTPDLRRSLEVLRTSVPAGWTNEDRPFQHRGEECVHVLSGSFRVTVGSSTWDLAEGDSITYESDVPHWYANESSEPVIIIGAVTPPSF
jgi:transcriptional regulator with XRE-family HTH domain